ncbi:hypothetical protein UlMin_041712, partial [Ulmus minor]
MEITRREGGEREEGLPLGYIFTKGEEEREKKKLKEEEGLLPSEQSIEGQRREINENEEGPPPVYHSIEEVEGKKREIKVEEEDEGPLLMYQSIAPLQMGPPTPMLMPEALKPQHTPMPLPVPKSRTPPEIAQMVCGSCRRLLKYSLGATRVQCSCLKCGSCTTFLMYPYGAPSVRCSSCQFVTKIG